MKRTLDFFETPVLKEKEGNFLQLLVDLGLDSTAIINNGSRGDYQFYKIDLSNLDDEHYSNLKSNLISYQTTFL